MAKNATMEQGGLETVQQRNEFYRDNYQRILAVLLVLLFANILLVGLVYYQVSHEPDPQYFAVSNDGKIVKLYALTEPVISQSVLLQWAADAAIEAADVVFMNSNMDSVTKAIKISYDTNKIARQNIIFALSFIVFPKSSHQPLSLPAHLTPGHV